MTGAELRAAFDSARLLFSLRPDASIVPGPGLTHLDVLHLEGQLHESVGRENERKDATKRAAKAPRPGRRTPAMDERATRYAEIKRAHPRRSDEDIASDIAMERHERDAGAYQRLKRALKRRP